MRRKGSRKSPGRFKAWVLAVALHLVVIGLLVIAFRWPLPVGQDVQIIEAVAVDEKQAQQLQAEAEKKRREAKRKRKEAEKKRLAQERKRKEQERKRAEAERKRKEAEKQRLAKEHRRKEEEKRKKAKEEQRQLEQEKRRLAEERQRLEEERQRVQAERKKREQEERGRKEAEDQLAALMAAEEREREETARKTRALTAAEKFKVLIRQKVTRNWARPPDTQEGLECMVRVRLVPNGEVLQVKVVRSSGNELFDRSVENAVYKASPLPLPEEKDLFEYFREIEFLFNPED